jgi:hypothetical protein
MVADLCRYRNYIFAAREKSIANPWQLLNPDVPDRYFARDAFEFDTDKSRYVIRGCRIVIYELL